MWRRNVEQTLRLLTFSLPLIMLPALTQAASICVFEPAGKAGDLYVLSQQYFKGVSDLHFKTYSDERIAVEDFKAGQCDGVVISTLRARPFNPFVGSIDAFGGLADTRSLKPLLGILNKPALAANMVQGEFEVAGVIPLGSLYVLVRDRRINGVAAAAGRKVAVLDWDKSQARLVEGLAAQPVAADVTSYATRFNNGQVDIMAAPALLFQRFEVQKGLGSKGAVYRFPLAQLTATVMLRRDRFPADFASQMRARAPAFVDVAMSHIQAAEAAVPAQYWLGLSDEERRQYQSLLAAARDQLTRDGIYDARMMAIMLRVRCAESPGGSECLLGRL